MLEIDRMSRLLDVLCPMHLSVDASGHILHAGPTLQKLRPDTPLAGERFLELFELRRPRAVRDMSDLLADRRLKLSMRFRDGNPTLLKGVIMPMPDGNAAGAAARPTIGAAQTGRGVAAGGVAAGGGAVGGAVINLSFGISILDAVRDYDLSAGDFPDTDLTIEMLYLVEAKSAAMAASRKLNQQLQSAMIAAEEQAFTDTLTGLKNRRAMDHILDRLIAGGQPFALMHVDLDFFKTVNDTMGHAAGDHVLQEVARVMVEETRSGDTVARVGGDEFVLLFDGLVEAERLDAAATRLISRLERPIPFGDQLARISASAGTVLSGDYELPEAARMLADADLALYASKHRGRACHSFFTPEMREAGGLPLASPGPETGVETGVEIGASTGASTGAEIRH